MNFLRSNLVVSTIVFVILLPALVSGIMTLVTHLLAGNNEAIKRWTGSFGIVTGVAIGCAIFLKEIAWIPNTVTELLPWVSILGFFWTGLELFWKKSYIQTWILRLIPLTGLGILLWRNFFLRRITSHYNPWTLGDLALNLAVPILTITSLWLVLEMLLNRSDENAYKANQNHWQLAIPTIILMVFSSSIAVLLFVYHTAIVAQIMGILTAALGAIMILTFIRPYSYLNSSIAASLAFFLGSALALGGWFSANLTWYALLITVLLPWVVWLLQKFSGNSPTDTLDKATKV